MATGRIPAPKGGVGTWQKYLKWLEDKNSKPGQFSGDTREFEGSAERGSGSDTLNACIAAIPPLKELVKEVGMVQAKEEWIIHHPWATEQDISNPFYTKFALLTPHHLISCCVTEALTRHFTDVIENDIGYNVNSPHNLLILPNSTVVACYLGVPLHEGGHKYELSAPALASTKSILASQIGKEKVWGKFDDKKAGYHAKVLKLVHQVIVKHFKCKKDLDHNKFIADMNQVSKKILKKLAKFHWLLHEHGADYKPGKGNLAGCCNTRLITSYIHGEGIVDDEGTTKASGRESAKGTLQTLPCASKREHEDDLQYFLHIEEGRKKLRRMGMKVATEVEWIMSASSSKTTATQDNKQTETA
ncbi:AHH domain-containing protein [Vibrio neptunius]|uniref:AHH domain-containing protein n=1 Tax=Vibrio neptunius TaxID=170651 RepID=UPI003CE52D2A